MNSDSSGGRRDAGAHWIEIHISHSRQQASFIEQRLRFEAPLPEPTGTFVLGIGPPIEQLSPKSKQQLLNIIDTFVEAEALKQRSSR